LLFCSALLLFCSALLFCSPLLLFVTHLHSRIKKEMVSAGKIIPYDIELRTHAHYNMNLNNKYFILFRSILFSFIPLSSVLFYYLFILSQFLPFSFILFHSLPFSSILIFSHILR